MGPRKAIQEESSRAEGQMGPEESISVSLMWIACCTAAVQDKMDTARWGCEKEIVNGHTAASQPKAGVAQIELGGGYAKALLNASRV